MKKYLIQNNVEVYKDDYEKGEGDCVNSWDDKQEIIAATPIEAVEKYFAEKLYYSFDAANADFGHEFDEAENLVQYSNMVDQDNSEATAKDLEEFKEGKKQLYSAHSRLFVYELSPVSFVK